MLSVQLVSNTSRYLNSSHYDESFGSTGFLRENVFTEHWSTRLGETRRAVRFRSSALDSVRSTRLRLRIGRHSKHSFSKEENGKEGREARPELDQSANGPSELWLSSPFARLSIRRWCEAESRANRRTTRPQSQRHHGRCDRRRAHVLTWQLEI